MKIPKRLQPLVDDGLVDQVMYQLMSGKEAQVYVVRCGDELRCAKVFKEAKKRSFKQAVQYQAQGAQQPPGPWPRNPATVSRNMRMPG